MTKVVVVIPVFLMKYSYAFEDLLEQAQVDLQPLRKKNSKRPMPPWTQYLLARYRKVIETTGV